MPDDAVDDLLTFDREHIWHPYSSATQPTRTRFVESAHGVRLRLRDEHGTHDVIDGMSSWWAAIHGYRVPELDAAARTQLDSMAHVMFGGLTHEPAIRLSRKLIELAPDGMEHVFLADSGSVSVEVALKMAWQIHAGTGRTKVFTCRGGYHGDTLAPMSVCDPVGGMHSLFHGVVPEQIFAPLPPAGLDVGADENYAEWERATRELWSRHVDEISTVVIEPVLQGAGGMRIYPPECVRLLAELAREAGATVVFDEIATGFGRTGTLWAADRCGVTPDIMCVGKALTGGYCTLAAVLCTPQVATAVSNSGGALMHGPTFMGNPLATAIASASLALLTPDLLARAAAMEDELSAGLAPARDLRHVADVRTIGAVGVVQLDEAVDVDAVTAAVVRDGVWLRPFRDLVYCMPPYVCSSDDVASITSAMVTAIREVHG